jgi:hypothetical protein
VNEATRLVEKCPVCGEPPKGSCRCPRSDSQCVNGHNWALCFAHDQLKVVTLKPGADTHKVELGTCICSLSV